MLEPAAAYVHFPWCVRKCPYCDFNSHPLRPGDDPDAYVRALIEDWLVQIENAAPSTILQTVFMGGGTPSLFNPQQMNRVLETLPLASGAEVTMEANPGTAEHAPFSEYAAAGINRLSIGAQSFDDAKLKSLGRIHTAAETRAAYQGARSAGFDNINLDLMWGLPEQSVAEALADLQAAIELAPAHISWYQLTIEPKTEFARRTPLLPVEDRLADMEQQGLALLADAGYERYEISAFAGPEHQCRHNLNYWSFGDYLGIGAGAHGKQSHPSGDGLAILRTRKPSQPRLYTADPRYTEQQQVPPEARPLEFMMNALRLVRGVPFTTFTERTGLDWSAVAPVWNRLVDQGLVTGERCATTPLGLRYLDSVLAAF